MRQFGLLLVIGVLLIGCGEPATPVPTPALRFITATPASTGSGAGPSTPTAPASEVPPTPIPTATPSPTPENAPTPIVVTSTPATPYAIIDAPAGYLNVREGPDAYYEASLGAYDNGAVVEIIGKQYSPQGDLWWLIPFAGGPYGQGWIFADYTIAHGIDKVPWVAAPPPPTPEKVTPEPPPIPHAIIDSPDGFVRVRRGPGEIYDSLGRYNNGRVVDIFGKQFSEEDELWWLVPFPSGPRGVGWVLAADTIGKYIEYVPWARAPATPTPTPTVTTTPDISPEVDWTITGRVTEAGTGQPIAGAFVGATLGTDGTVLSVTTNGDGEFIIVGEARDEGDLVLNIAAQGYLQRTITSGPATPREYHFPMIELAREEAPLVTWAIFGRVIELGTLSPVAGAQIEALLGVDAVRLETVTNANGEFSMNGQARNQGTLTVNVTAEGYQPTSFTSDQADSRIYNLPELTLVPQAGSCRYESVIDLTETAALARLQNLSFTNVSTQTVDTGGDPTLVDRVLTQTPDPPPEGQAVRISCQIPVRLGIGVDSAAP